MNQVIQQLQDHNIKLKEILLSIDKRVSIDHEIAEGFSIFALSGE